MAKCVRCGHRSGGCPRCGRFADSLGAQINDGHYCHRDDAPPPSCYELTAMNELATTSHWWDDWDCPDFDDSPERGGHAVQFADAPDDGDRFSW